MQRWQVPLHRPQRLQVEASSGSTISTCRRSKPTDGRSTANDLATNASYGVQAAGAAEPHDAVAASAGGREAGAGPVHSRPDRS